MDKSLTLGRCLAYMPVEFSSVLKDMVFVPLALLLVSVPFPVVPPGHPVPGQRALEDTLRQTYLRLK